MIRISCDDNRNIFNDIEAATHIYDIQLLKPYADDIFFFRFGTFYVLRTK